MRELNSKDILRVMVAREISRVQQDLEPVALMWGDDQTIGTVNVLAVLAAALAFGKAEGLAQAVDAWVKESGLVRSMASDLEQDGALDEAVEEIRRKCNGQIPDILQAALDDLHGVLPAEIEAELDDILGQD